MEKTKDPIEINKYRDIISEEIRRVNNQPYDADDSQKTRWKNIKGTTEVAPKDLRTNGIGIKKKHWFNDECQRAVLKRNEARKNMLQNTTPESIEEYKLRKTLVNKPGPYCIHINSINYY
jgi:hypothetical protein